MRVVTNGARDVRTGGLYGDSRDASAGEEHQGDQPGAPGSAATPFGGICDQSPFRKRTNVAGKNYCFGIRFGRLEVRELGVQIAQDVGFHSSARRLGAEA